MSTEELHAVALAVIRLLEALHIPYAIGGALATSLLGAPRSTLAVDLVADLSPEQAGEFAQALGPGFYAEPDAARAAARARRSFNVIHLGTMLKVDVFIVKDTPFGRSQFARRRQVPFYSPDGPLVWVIAPEDMILQKLAWYTTGGGLSQRQWNDVLGVLRVHAATLDRAYLSQWAAQLGLEALWSRAQDEAGRGGRV